MIRLHFTAKEYKMRQGSFLAAALIIIVVLTSIGLALSGVVTTQYQHTERNIYVANAEQAAEAAIEQSVSTINTDDSFAGYTTPQVFFNNANQGYGTFTSTVSDIPSSNAKQIIAEGDVYASSASSSPIVTRKIKVIIVGTTSSGYAVSTGPGGLILGGSAAITNSNVYVDGKITMTGASSIGTASNPVNVNVANYQCPTTGGSTYPALCTDGTQPISLAWSTNIYGTVCATGQTSDGPNNNIQGGSTGLGLKPSCTSPRVAQPTYNRQAQIDAVATTASGNDTNYNCSKWKSGVGFTRTWPAKLELTGNVNAASSCDLTITGDVYITGNLTIGGSANIKVAGSVGTTRPHIFVDGTITIGGSASFSANASGTGIDFVSFKNSTGNPAATPTGSDLFNSQKQTTVTAGGAGNAPGMIFDAYWGTIKITGSGNVGAAAGQTVDLSGAGTVVFGTELNSGSKTWTISSYQQLYN